MNIRSGLYGMHQNSQSNTTNSARRSFSFGKYMTNTSDWTGLFSLNVITFPSQLDVAVFWQSNSMRNSGNAENYITVRTGVASFNGYGWTQETNGWDYTQGNGINQGGQLWRNGYNALFIRDYAWAGSPVYVTYHVDVISKDWDKINVNYY